MLEDDKDLQLHTAIWEALSWFRWSVLRSRCSSGSVRVGFVVYKVALWPLFL